ncbi:MAG: Hsp70 family protein [Aureliella sp.]
MNQSDSPIIGIDLGTTNSVVAAYINGKVQVLEEDGEAIVPSVVGIALDGKLVIGRAAKNQLAAFPERTIASVKRRMGEAVRLTLADQQFSPPEISAMILRRLRQRAEQALGCEVTRAVITVPAFFDDGQRQATREAGTLAGLTVERIINEPTAASLVYVAGSPDREHLIVYDLGGGTFDVSIVRVESGVVEVLSSKGDTHLGGDDFDQVLAQHVATQFQQEFGIDLLDNPATRWRLMQACERAKCELSSVTEARIAEEFIATLDDRPVSLDVTVTREEYEALIHAFVERTIGCVDTALGDANVKLDQIDQLVLVGGSTRTPLVQRRLREEFGLEPQWSVNPDLAVALGAATQAAMQQGHAVGPVLIDVATHTLGIAAVTGMMDLEFFPIIHRNAPLPAHYEEVFQKVHHDQDMVRISVFQGESPNLDENTPLGRFMLENLNTSENADKAILVRFDLTLDGILKVTAAERKTGRSKTVTIENALQDASPTSQGEAFDRLETLFQTSAEFMSVPADRDEGLGDSLDEDFETATSLGGATSVELDSSLADLIGKARSMQSTLKSDDAEDVERLLELIGQAQKYNKPDLLPGLQEELDDLLFYLAH